jgi:hypothetical protein
MEDEYLNTIAIKTELHNKTLENTKKYLIKNQITNTTKIQNCLIMGQIWAADMLGKPLNQYDLLLYLGDDEPPIADHHEMLLDEKLKGKTLNEILDLTVAADGGLV